MARVKDLWFSEVPVRDGDGKPVKGPDGRVVTQRRKTGKHPDNGGNRDAKRWLACWIDPDGNEVTKAFQNKAAGLNHARKMEADAERGEYIDPKAGRELFGPLARKHVRLLKIGAGSRRQYESDLRNHIEPAFAGRSVKSVKPSEIAEWLAGPLSTYSIGVQLRAFCLLRGAFDLAVADKIRRDNPARSPIVRPPSRGEAPPRTVWDFPVVWRVVDEHPERYRPIPVCEAGMGMRQGEAFALAEEDIDFENMKVTISRQVQKYQGRQYFKLPKDGKTRTVPMSRGMAGYLRAHMEKYPPRPYTLPWMREDGKVSAEAHTCRLLFLWESRDPRTNGKPVDTGSYDRVVWYPALSRAGVGPAPAETGRRYVSPGRKNGSHMLRHIFETTLDDGGVSHAGQVEFMGHSKRGQVITTAVYGHVTEKTFEAARRAVDRALFRLRPVRSGGTVTELRRAQ